MKRLIFLSFLILALPYLSAAQNADSIGLIKDSFHYSPLLKPVLAWDSILMGNKLLNSSGEPVALTVKPKKENGMERVFYLLTGLLLFLASLRYFYSRYFSNLFRVFFNTSLRQSQLTDQLLQAKFPSLLFNLFFLFSGGLFIYFLLMHYGWIREKFSWTMIGGCIVFPGVVYFFKYCLLKFTGWVTGYREETNTYIFIFFLINKILGIFLVPFIILLAFADISLVNPSIVAALVIIGFFLLLRFIRSYSLLQNRVKVSRFHFFLYILGVEILPLLLISKGLVILLNKNL